MPFVKLKKIDKRWRLAFAIVWVLILIGGVCALIFYSNEKWTDVLIKVLIGMAIPSITMLIMYLLNSFLGNDIETEHDKDISKRIWHLLRAEKAEDSIIHQLYDRQSVYTVMRNSIAYFSSRLGDSFCQMVNNEWIIVRENFDYKVKVFLDRTTGIYSLRQNIKYTRHFTPSEKHRPVRLSSCFTFSANALRTAFKNDSLFFREELEDDALIDNIKQSMSAGDERQVIELLKYKLTIFNTVGEEIVIDNNQIKVEKLTDHEKLVGVIFTYEFQTDGNGRSMYITASNDGKVSYTASVGCHYPVPAMSRFLCVFSNPVIGRTRFSIEFDNDIINNVEDDVQIDQFITSPHLHAQKIRYPDPYEIQFETQETIFPVSAIVTRWKAADKKPVANSRVKREKTKKC